jgi:TonB family protein
MSRLGMQKLCCLRLGVVCAVLAAGFFFPPVSARQAVSPQASRIRIAWRTLKAIQVSGNEPVYPPLAEMAGIEGSVRIEFVVTTDGATKNFTVLSGHPLLVQSALDAVRSWRFTPTIVAGALVEVETVANLDFFLPGDSPEEFVAALRKAVGKHPDNPDHRMKLARGLLAVGKPEEAAVEFRQAISLRPKDAEPHFGLGDALRASGDLDSAIEEYRQGLLLKPRSKTAHFELAVLLEKKGDLDAAVAEHREGLRQNPKQGYRHNNFGILLMKKGDAEAAIEEFRLALRFGFNVAFAHFALGRALERKGDRDGALREYQKAVKMSPQTVEFREARDRLANRQKP